MVAMTVFVAVPITETEPFVETYTLLPSGVMTERPGPLSTGMVPIIVFVAVFTTDTVFPPPLDM